MAEISDSSSYLEGHRSGYNEGDYVSRHIIYRPVEERLDALEEEVEALRKQISVILQGGIEERE